MLSYDDPDEKRATRARLNNLGYPSSEDAELEESILRFQKDYKLPESGLESDGSLPPVTKARLQHIFETDCDASRPAT